MSRANAVVLLSGGMDSAVLLYHLLSQDYDVRALTVHYGQRHAREIASAREIAAGVGVPHDVCNLETLRELLSGSSQTDDTIAVPQGHYTDLVMKQTVVPNRNMLLLAVAAATAISHGMNTVAYAAHAGDHCIYPDCRPEFVAALRGALALCHYDGGVQLIAPFAQSHTKSDLVTLGTQLNVPFVATWTCYEGRTYHCGRCGTCVERLLAFLDAGITDPVVYMDREYWRTQT